MADTSRDNGIGGGIFIALGPIIGLGLGWLLDEPSMGLAPQLVEEIFEIVRSLNNGNEIFRKEGVIAAAVNGENICFVDATGIEVWRMNYQEVNSP